MYLNKKMGVDDIPLSFNNTKTDVNGTLSEVGHINGTTANGPGIQISKDPYASHSFLWKIGIIFAITGIIILTSFIAMYGVNYTRRHRLFRRHRRRQHHQQQTLAFENQLSVTDDELVEGSRHHDNDHVTVHQSCTNTARRWSRDENATQPRSRSNSRSRSLSPGSGGRARSPAQTTRSHNNELEDDHVTAHSGLENVRLAFKEDTPRYDATVQRNLDM